MPLPMTSLIDRPNSCQRPTARRMVGWESNGDAACAVCAPGSCGLGMRFVHGWRSSQASMPARPSRSVAPSGAGAWLLRVELDHDVRRRPLHRAPLRQVVHPRLPGRGAESADVGIAARHVEAVDDEGNAFGAQRRRPVGNVEVQRSEEHTSELQSLMRISYAVFCLKKKNTIKNRKITEKQTT